MPHACKLQKWGDVYPRDWKMHNSNLIRTEAAARWRIAHCMFMNRNHYRDWGAYWHGPVTQNFFFFFFSIAHCSTSKFVCLRVWYQFSRGHFYTRVCGCEEELTDVSWPECEFELRTMSPLIRSCHLRGLWNHEHASFKTAAPQLHWACTSARLCSYQMSHFNSCASTSLGSNANVQQLLRSGSTVCGAIDQRGSASGVFGNPG